MKRIVFAAAMLAASSVYAEGYVGGGIGQGKLNLDCTGTTTCDTSVTTGKLMAGYRFSNGLGLEVTAINFGKAVGSVSFSGTRVGVDITHSTIAIGLASSIAMSPSWSLVSRLGVASNKAEATARAGGFSASESKTSVAPYASIGVGYAINQTFSIEAAIDATTFKDPSDDRYGAYFGGIALKVSF